MAEAIAVCAPCERPHEHMRPLADVMRTLHTIHPEAAESVMEYFSALHDRDFDRAERALERMRRVGYYNWMKLKPWGPFDEAGETEEDAQKRWNLIVEAIGHAIKPGNPEEGIRILERVAWTSAPKPIYNNVKDHYVNRKVPGSMIKIYRTFSHIHGVLVQKITELEGTP